MTQRLTIAEQSRLLQSGEASSRELTQASLDRIALHDEALNAFIEVTPEHALTAAKAAVGAE